MVDCCELHGLDCVDKLWNTKVGNLSGRASASDLDEQESQDRKETAPVGMFATLGVAVLLHSCGHVPDSDVQACFFTTVAYRQATVICETFCELVQLDKAAPSVNTYDASFGMCWSGSGERDALIAGVGKIQGAVQLAGQLRARCYAFCCVDSFCTLDTQQYCMCCCNGDTVCDMARTDMAGLSDESKQDNVALLATTWTREAALLRTQLPAES
eukprot:6479922-Amphidinium_carterae.2